MLIGMRGQSVKRHQGSRIGRRRRAYRRQFLVGPQRRRIQAVQLRRRDGHFAGPQGGIVVRPDFRRSQPLVDRSPQKMGIVDVHKGCKDKAAALRKFAEKHGLELKDDLLHGRRRERSVRHGIGRHERGPGQRPDRSANGSPGHGAIRRAWRRSGTCRHARRPTVTEVALRERSADRS